MKITKLETFLVKPRWLFLKMHTDEGLVGLGEPILEGRALTVAQAVAELEPYLIGKDPTRVVHHWQAMYKHAFYRGGPVLTSALSGVEHALWDLAGKALGCPSTSCSAGRCATASRSIRASALHSPGSVSIQSRTRCRGARASSRSRPAWAGRARRGSSRRRAL